MAAQKQTYSHTTTKVTGTDSFLWFVPIFQSLSLRWGLGLGLCISLVWTSHQNLRECLPTLGGGRWSLPCFVPPVCFRLRLHGLTLSLLGLIGARVAFIAQIPHVQESLLQALYKFCWTCLRALTETGHWEDDVVWLRVVACAVSI